MTSTGANVVNNHAASIANTARLTCSAEQDEPVYTNVGGGQVGDFAADSSFTGGNAAPVRNVSIDRSAVPAPVPPQSVYQSERWGVMTYRIGGLSPNSQHSVKLHFAEVYFTATNQRKFHVDINGTRKLTNFDIFAAADAKNKAVMKSFDVSANASGQIFIDFKVGSKDQPKLDGLVIE